MSLPTPHFRPAFRTTVALAAVAADTDREDGPASRVAANPKAKNSVIVHVHIRHKEIMPPAQVELHLSATGAGWRGLGRPNFRLARNPGFERNDQTGHFDGLPTNQPSELMLITRSFAGRHFTSLSSGRVWPRYIWGRRPARWLRVSMSGGISAWSSTHNTFKPSSLRDVSCSL